MKIEKKQIELKTLPENKSPSKISLDIIEKLFLFPYCSPQKTLFLGEVVRFFFKNR